MLRNFCDKCNREISLEHYCEISSNGFNVYPFVPGAHKFNNHLSLCDKCHEQLHNIIMNWNPKIEGEIEK